MGYVVLVLEAIPFSMCVYISVCYVVVCVNWSLSVNSCLSVNVIESMGVLHYELSRSQVIWIYSPEENMVLFRFTVNVEFP